MAAILAHTDQIVFLEDGDVADLRPWGVTITDVDGLPLERPVTTIDWSPEAAEKGGYEHFMLKEIHEQPESLGQAITGRVNRDDRIAVEELAGLEDMLRSVTRVELVACGSAHYASLIGASAHPGLDRPAGPRERRAPNSATAPPPLDGTRSSSRSPSRARRPTRSPRSASRASAAARSSR